MSTLYEKDFHEWCISQELFLRDRNFSSIDFENLAEEIASMGGSQRDELTNRLGILIAHLLKWKFQPERRGSIWKYTIEEQTRRIERLMRKNPSLQHYYNECLQDAIEDGTEKAVAETGLKRSTFEYRIDLEQLKKEFKE